jgi:conjugal transfer pilus assembly protein TraB
MNAFPTPSSRPRTWLFWGVLAAALVPLAAVLLAAAGSGSARAAGTEPGGGATAGSTAGSTAGPEAGAAPSFGAAVPSEQFVQNFQQQVTRQLQSALSEARQESEARMRQWEEQQRQAAEQLAHVQHSLDAGRPDHGGAPAAEDSPASEGAPSPPEVHSRQAALRATTSSFEQPADIDAPAPSPREARGAGAKGRNISPHGFVEGRLLNGVVAVVGGPERESVVALQGHYEGANGFPSRLDGCLALVQGHSDPAAGRIDFKLSRLTCNFPDGASHTWDAAGWLVDADGIRGLRATLVSNAASKAALAAAGGAIDGLGQRLSQEQYRTSLSALGASSAFGGNASRDALGGAASGTARSAAQAMADAYNLFPPSLQVGGGTPVTVVLANELRLPATARAASSTWPAPAQ